MNKYILSLILLSSMLLPMEQDGLWIPPQQTEQKIIKKPSDIIVGKIVQLSSTISSLNTAIDDEQKKAFCNQLYELNEHLKNADKETSEFVQRYLQKSGTRTIWDNFAEKQVGDFSTQVNCYYGDLYHTLYNNPSTIVENTIKVAPHLFPTDHLQKWQKRIKRKNSKTKKKSEQLVTTAAQVPIKTEVLAISPEELSENGGAQDEDIDDESDLPEEIRQQLANLERERSTQNVVPKKSKKKKIKQIPHKKETVEKIIVPPLPEKPVQPVEKKSVIAEKPPKEKKPITWQDRFGNAKSVLNSDPQKGIAQLEQLIEECDVTEIQGKAATVLAETYDQLKPVKKGVKKDLTLAVHFYKVAREHGTITEEMAYNALLSSIVLKEKEQDKEKWLQLLSQKATNESNMLWAQAIDHLLANNQKKAAEFFAQWHRKKNMVKPEMYDLFFESINEWLGQYLNEFTEKHSSMEYDQAVLWYSLGKMFKEGSKKWQDKGNEGWTYMLSDKITQAKIGPLQLMKYAASYYMPAAYHIGMQADIAHEYRLLFLQPTLSAKKEQLNVTEQNTVRTTLKDIAYQGNFAAAIVLAKEAYAQNKLMSWLHQNKSIAPKLSVNEWMAPLIYESNTEFEEALQKYQKDNVLARVLLMGCAFVQCENEIMYCTDPQKLQSVLEKLTGIMEVYKDLTAYGVVQFEQGLRGLAYHRFKCMRQPVEGIWRAMRDQLDKQLKEIYEKDDYSAYLYLRFLSEELHSRVIDKERGKLFVKLTKQLEKSFEYKLHALEVLAEFYLKVNDTTGAEFYLQRIMEDPSYWLDEHVTKYVLDIHTRIKDQLVTNEITSALEAVPGMKIMPDDEEDMRELKNARRSFYCAQELCNRGEYKRAASTLHHAVRELSLLQYFHGTILFDRDTFDRIMCQLRVETDETIKQFVAEIDKDDIAYNAMIDLEKITAAKDKMLCFRNLIDEYKQIIKKSGSLEEWIAKVRAVPAIKQELQNNNIQEDEPITVEKLFKLITAQSVFIQCELDHLVWLPNTVQDADKQDLQNQIVRLLQKSPLPQEIPMSKYDEHDLAKVANNVLESAYESCKKGNFKGVAVVIKQAIYRKMLLSSIESSLDGKKKKLFDRIMVQLKQQDNDDIKTIVTEIESLIKRYQEQLNHQAIATMKQRYTTVHNLYDQYTEIQQQTGNKIKEYVTLLSQIMQQIPSLFEELTVITTDEQEVSEKIFTVLSQEIVNTERELNRLANMPVLEIPGDVKVINAYQVLKKGADALSVMEQVYKAEEVMATLEEQ